MRRRDLLRAAGAALVAAVTRPLAVALEPVEALPPGDEGLWQAIVMVQDPVTGVWRKGTIQEAVGSSLTVRVSAAWSQVDL